MDVKKDFDQRVEAFANAVNVAKISQMDSREVRHDMLVGLNGLVANLFPKKSECKMLNDLPVMTDVWNFLDSLEEEDGKFVVRMPRSLHAALQAEAEHEGVSLNQLVVSKMAVSLQTQLEYSNDARQHYVSVPVMQSILDSMPPGDLRTAAALGRFAGFRLPSELAQFTWDCVNLSERVMVVWDVKRTRDRVTPIFPELHKYLQQHWEVFGDQSEHVIVDPSHRDPDANLRTTFGKYVVRAVHAKWPRLMQNLRASCETDLLNKFPIHQVVKWIGNSPHVALKHYAMVSDRDIAMAVAQPLTKDLKSNEKQEPSEKEQTDS